MRFNTFNSGVNRKNEGKQTKIVLRNEVGTLSKVQVKNTQKIKRTRHKAKVDLHLKLDEFYLRELHRN